MSLFKKSYWRHLMYELRGGYLMLPVALALAVTALGLLLPGVHAPGFVAWADRSSWLTPSDPAAAQLLLGAIAGSCITVVSVVYSVLLIALTFASMQFSPRILTSFVKDRVSQVTLGVYIGTFNYCLVLLPRVHAGPDGLPRLSIACALVLATACLFMLLYFIHHIAMAIQVNYLVDNIAVETERVLKRVFGPPTPELAPALEEEAEAGAGTVLLTRKSGYIQYVDLKELLTLATRGDACIFVHRGVGKFVPAGSPCLTVRADHLVSEDFKQSCLDCLYVGAVRSLEGDVEFGLLQLVDIALKAISPAVNDPSTCISCIDHLSGILLLAATLRAPVAQKLDSYGKVRVVMKVTSFPRLLDIAYNQICPYGKGDMAVSLRLMRALEDIARVTSHPLHLAAVLRKARRVTKSCAGCFAEEDCTQLFARLKDVEALVALRSEAPIPSLTLPEPVRSQRPPRRKGDRRSDRLRKMAAAEASPE